MKVCYDWIDYSLLWLTVSWNPIVYIFMFQNRSVINSTVISDLIVEHH